jgi:hypothetical protein
MHLPRYAYQMIELMQQTGSLPEHALFSMQRLGLVDEQGVLTPLAQEAQDDAPFSLERLREFDYQWDLDCGGYEWEFGEIFPESLCLEDPPYDYLGVVTPTSPWSTLFYFAPNDLPDWPKTFGDYTLEATGEMYDHDHECICHGRPSGQGWEATGNCSDSPYPDCSRCGGTGNVDVEGGGYAIYRKEDDE